MRTYSEDQTRPKRIGIAKSFVRFAGIASVIPDPGSWSGAGFDPGSRLWIPCFRRNDGKGFKVSLPDYSLGMAKWTLFQASDLMDPQKNNP